MTALETTPFHERTAPLVRGAAWRRWAGHAVASAYELVHDREYAAVRSSAALFDVSPLRKYLIRGRDAVRLLDRMVTRDVTRAAVGQVLYTTWCDGHGKVIDDGTISRLGEREFRLTAAEPNLRWLTRNAFRLEVEIEDVSERLGALALQGPLAREILNRVASDSLDELGYFRVMRNRLADRPVTISRTGYTGDLGYEIWVEAADALPVWDALTAVGRDYDLTPAGIWALDVARIEAGLVMLDVDYYSAHRALIPDQLSTPYELSLDWSVKLDKGPYNGRAALRAEHERGPGWRFVGIEIEWESLEELFRERGLPPAIPSVAWRSSAPVYKDGDQIGYATSGCWSPLLKKPLALAHLEAEFAAPGRAVEIEVTVEHRRRAAVGRVSALPFLELQRKKR
ncbi:MAG: aminomethyltransferase family protein [Gemmatimonadales bacterium]